VLSTQRRGSIFGKRLRGWRNSQMVTALLEIDKEGKQKGENMKVINTRRVPYTPCEPSKVKRKLLSYTYEIAESEPCVHLQEHCDMIVAYSPDYWKYDPLVGLKVYSHLGEVRVVRLHRGRLGPYQGETLFKTMVGREQCGEFYNRETVKEIIEDYVEQVMKVLASVTVYTERSFGGVSEGDELIVKNGKMYVSDDCSFVVEGSDSYRVLEVDERWVNLEGLGYVGWDKVISLI